MNITHNKDVGWTRKKTRARYGKRYMRANSNMNLEEIKVSKLDDLPAC